MLHSTNKIAKRYRIKFGEEKSKYMCIGTPCNTNLLIGDLELKTTETYKYLGVVINSKGNLADHIQSIKCKVEVSIQTILNVAANPSLRPIQMETIWKLYTTCTIPIITYAAEAWIPTKQEKKELQKIHMNAIKRILKTPKQTPNEAIQIETGIASIEQIMEEQQTKYYYKEKLRSADAHLVGTPWEKKIRLITEENKINLDQIIANEPAWRGTKLISHLTKTANIRRMIEMAESKSKTKEMLKSNTILDTVKMPQYMKSLSRSEASAIFATRARMLKVKANYKSAYQSPECRWCNNPTETQQHILTECPSFNHITNDFDILKAIGNNQDYLSKEAKQIIQIIDMIEEPISQQPNHPITNHPS
jgi:hypothetical protein